jgi:hypothetical protein
MESAGSLVLAGSSGFDDDNARRALVAVRSAAGSAEVFAPLGSALFGLSALAV